VRFQVGAGVPPILATLPKVFTTTFRTEPHPAVLATHQVPCEAVASDAGVTVNAVPEPLEVAEVTVVPPEPEGVQILVIQEKGCIAVPRRLEDGHWMDSNRESGGLPQTRPSTAHRVRAHCITAQRPNGDCIERVDGEP